MFCKVQVIGFVAQECETKGKSGVSWGQFSVAYSGSRKSLTTGEYESIFLPCKVFKENHNRAVEMLHKGDLVYCEGSLDIQQYNDKNGVARTFTSLNVGMFRVLKSKNATTQLRKGTIKSKAQDKYDDFDTSDKEIPF